MGVEVRYFAGAAAAAGTEAERVDLVDGASVGALLAGLAGRRPALVPVLEVASVLVDEVVVRDRSQALRDGAQVDVLPPFAGG
ncbi:Molybdopterin converting factor, small subunit [Quadrisphaera sp. DSM 44207]|nr:Molybdopterin converting factor, small subunit [Quadrisphaera sp. DSM 44207]